MRSESAPIFASNEGKWVSGGHRTRGAPPSRRPRLWIFNHYAVPPDGGFGTRHFDLASELVGGGYDVTIFAAGVSHSTGREERVHGTRLIRTQLVDGVRFVWLKTVPYRGNSLARILNMLSYSVLAVFAHTSLPRPDWVVGSSVHPFAALAGSVVAKLRRAPFLFEIRDLWPQHLVDLGLMRERSLSVRLLRRIEEHLYRTSDGVITLLEGAGDYVAEHGGRMEQVTWIPNGAALLRESAASGTMGRPDPGWEARVSSWRDRHELVAVYAGSFGAANDVAILVDAAAIAARGGPASVGVLLVGGGPERASIERRIEDLSLTNVLLLDAIPKVEVPRLLSYADVGLLHLAPNPVYKYGISPNKLFDYFAARLPVISAVDTPYDIVRRSGAGISVPAGNPEAIAQALQDLAALPASARVAMGSTGRAYVERHHDMRVLAERLRLLLEATGSRGMRRGSSSRQ